MRILKTKAFHKFALKNQILDRALIEAVQRADLGLVDAELGANIIKQRISRNGQGKRGGFRSFIFYRLNDNNYFVAGISKNERENISSQELLALKELAKEYARLTESQVIQQIKNGYFIEVLPEAINE